MLREGLIGKLSQKIQYQHAPDLARWYRLTSPRFDTSSQQWIDQGVV